MPRKPSGQPRWHSLTCKLPAPLYEELTRAIALQDTTLSDFVRESVTRRLQGHGDTSAAERRTLRAVARQLRCIIAQLDAEAPDTTPGQHQNALTTPWTPGDSEERPPFDPARFVLSAKLCPGKHEWGQTGKTLLTIKGKKCVACQSAGQRTRRAQKRGVVDGPIRMLTKAGK